MLTERSPEECWSKQQGADSALPGQETLKREGAWSKREEEKVRWRGEGACYVAADPEQSASAAGGKGRILCF